MSTGDSRKELIYHSAVLREAPQGNHVSVWGQKGVRGLENKERQVSATVRHGEWDILTQNWKPRPSVFIFLPLSQPTLPRLPDASRTETPRVLSALSLFIKWMLGHFPERNKWVCRLRSVETTSLQSRSSRIFPEKPPWMWLSSKISVILPYNFK